MDDFKRRPVNRVGQQGSSATPNIAKPQPARPAPTVSVQQSGNAVPTPAQYSVTPQVSRSGVASSAQPAPLQPRSIDGPKTGLNKPKKSRKKLVWWIVGAFIALVVAAVVGVLVWYNTQLSAVNTQDTTKKLVTVQRNTAPTGIANLLKEQGLIRDTNAFLLYTRISGTQNSLQAGTYRLSPSETTQEIVNHLVSGKVDVFKVLLYEGATLTDKRSTPDRDKTDVTTALKRAGFTEEEIKTGLQADYSEYATTLFQGRPATSDLEGYVYGDTYQLSSAATVEDVLRASFDHYWKIIQDNNLVKQFEARGLTLYEGITLASIIQRESKPNGDDKPQISQIFYKRLEMGMPLGSDVTYQYAADKLGVQRDTNLESPYNTRIKVGLPPGPIAVPHEDALKAVANPAPGDYIYFLSGDDDVTYYGRTLQEHEANIVNHCQKKCQII